MALSGGHERKFLIYNLACAIVGCERKFFYELLCENKRNGRASPRNKSRTIVPMLPFPFTSLPFTTRQFSIANWTGSRQKHALSSNFPWISGVEISRRKSRQKVFFDFWANFKLFARKGFAFMSDVEWADWVRRIGLWLGCVKLFKELL